MTASWRLAATLVLSTALTIDTAALVCVPLGLSGTWLTVLIVAAGPFWAFAADRGIRKAESAWKALQGAPGASRGDDGDAATLLALFATHQGPVCLFDAVLVLSPEPDPPSWLHPAQRWNIMIAWTRRNGELVAEAGRLAEAGLLQRMKHNRRWDGMSIYEATGLGRDVAARNAEMLLAGQTEERA